MIRVDNLRYGYGVEDAAVKEVTFSLGAGETLAVVGPNGSGKSTLLRLLCGLLTPQEGRVWLDGQPLHTLKSSVRARHVAIVFQNPDDQIFKSRVADELRFGPGLAGVETGIIDVRMHHAADICGIAGSLDQNPYDLSRARRKRVCLASALMMETPLVLLDEPLSGQDPAGREAVIHVMEHLRSRGAAVVAVTHDMNFAASFDYLLALENGRIKAFCTPRELFSDSALGLPLPDALAIGRMLGLPEPCLTESELIRALHERGRNTCGKAFAGPGAENGRGAGKPLGVHGESLKKA